MKSTVIRAKGDKAKCIRQLTNIKLTMFLFIRAKKSLVFQSPFEVYDRWRTVMLSYLPNNSLERASRMVLDDCQLYGEKYETIDNAVRIMSPKFYSCDEGWEVGFAEGSRLLRGSLKFVEKRGSWRASDLESSTSSWGVQWGWQKFSEGALGRGCEWVSYSAFKILWNLYQDTRRKL